jgi:hypothetical protein
MPRKVVGGRHKAGHDTGLLSAAMCRFLGGLV